MIHRAPVPATCPICGKLPEEGDRLVAEWYEPMQWFVLRHYKNVTAKSETVGGVVELSAKTWCAQANHPAVQSLTDEWRRANGGK